MPFVYGSVKLHTGIGTRPGGESNIIPKFLCRCIDFITLPLILLVSCQGCSVFQSPEKTIGNADRVIRVLPGNGAVSFTFIVGRITGCYQGGHFLFSSSTFQLINSSISGMIQIKAHHLSRPPCCSAGFNRTRRTVAYFEE